MKKRHPPSREFATGTIRIHPRGFGFLISEDKKNFPQDIFIPRHATKGAVDGDRVEVAINLKFISEKGPEGQVKKILERGRSHLAGVISYIGKKNQIYAYVPLLGEEQVMRIAPPEQDLNVGDRVIIHVVDWGGKQREALGEVSSYIGHISDPTYDVEAAIEEFELQSNFSKSALDEAKSYGSKILSKDFENREDLRHLCCFTIDPDTAKDYDDALSLSVGVEGNFHLGVHIADVSHYVKPKSALDREAAKRCNSVYFPGRVVPMLPHELSSHLCSLKQNVNRLTISVLITLDADGNLIKYQICRSVIKSQKRLTYKEALAIIEERKKSTLAPNLKKMVDLCLLLKKKRATRGSIEFSLPDLSLELDEVGKIKKN